MKQYIKKALWIIPFVFSLNLSALTYKYNGNSPASNPANWTYTPPRGTATGASNFTTANDVFDLNGKGTVDIAGMTIGEVIFINQHSTSGATITNSGTVVVSSSVSPTFNTTGTNPMVVSFSSSGTFSFEYSSTTVVQEITPGIYFNLTFKNSKKSISGAVTVNNVLTESSGYEVIVTGPINFGSSSSISANSNTVFTLSSTGDVGTDNRSNKNFPSTWKISKGSNWYNLPVGTYEKLNLASDQYYGVILKGNTTISTNIIGTTSDQIIDITDLGVNTNRTLTINATAANNPVYITGDPTANLIIGSSSYDLYMDPYIEFQTNSLKNITITNSGSVTLKNNLYLPGGNSSNFGQLTVDTLSSLNMSGFLTLQSTSNGTARISKSSGTLSGSYTVEQYIPADRDYRFYSPPVVGGTALQLRDNETTPATSGRGIHITGTGGSSKSFDVSTTNNPSAFSYNESSAGDISTIYTSGATATDDPGWTAFTAGGSGYTLTNGAGYRIFVRGDRTLSLTSSTVPTANNTTIWVKGTYPGYSKTITVSNSNRSKTNDGMNFVGNPYPSSLDWNVIGRSNVDNGYMVYKNSNSSFVGWNGTTGGAGRYISPNQGFFVYCTNTSGSGGTLTINEWDKSNDVGGQLFQTKLINHLKINLMYDSSYNSDTYLHFRPDASDIRDIWDIPQMVNFGTNVATLDASNFPYNINSMGELDSFQSIPLSVQGTPEASLKLSFFDIGSFGEHRIELVDNYKNITMPITEGMIYNFDITKDSFSYKNGRFFINFTKQNSAFNKEISNEPIVKITTNPIENNKINVVLAKPTEMADYQILDITGKCLLTGQIKESKNIDAKNLSSGHYYLKIKTNNNLSQTIQFVK